jgi:nucleotide-binding universal stress UspA family protein
MKPIRCILAATDLSSAAAKAEARAALLAKEQSAEQLELMHVVSGSALQALRRLLAAAPAEIEQQLIAQAETQLNKRVRDLASQYNMTVTSYIATGQVHREIVARAGQLPADLLVLGARGSNLMRELFLGTTAERLLHLAKWPLLVVKRSPRAAYRRVVVPVDFSAASAPCLELALRLAPDADITALHAFAVPFESKLHYAGVDDEHMHLYRSQERQKALQQMEALFAALELPAGAVSHTVRHGSAPPVIRAKEREVNADLIVMGKHGQSALEELLLGSVTRHILSESRCDVLVFAD